VALLPELTHDLWVLPVTRFAAKVLDPLSLPAGVRLGVYFAGFSATATAAATLYHYLLEKPAILLKDRFSIAGLQPVGGGRPAARSAAREPERVGA
jgi:peptidoglycan/LPS O-acetylase OafA/YrhL